MLRGKAKTQSVSHTMIITVLKSFGKDGCPEAEKWEESGQDLEVGLERRAGGSGVP